MVETWFIYHSKANCWNFLIVCRFLLSGALCKLRPWQVLTSHAQKRLCKKADNVLTSPLHSALWIGSETSKRFNVVIGLIAINLRLTYADFPENITSKVSIIIRHAHTTVVQKGSEHRICQKTKRKRKEESFYKNRKRMVIEPWMSALNLLLVWSDSWQGMQSSKSYQLFYIIVLGMTC